MNEGVGFYKVLCSEEFKKKFKRNEFRSPVELNKFRNIVEDIVKKDGKYPTEYPTEVIGEFFVSPRGHRRERIAWFREGNIFYFCEPLHHEGSSSGDYENFCRKADSGIIKRKDYSGWRRINEVLPIPALAA